MNNGFLYQRPKAYFTVLVILSVLLSISSCGPSKKTTKASVDVLLEAQQQSDTAQPDSSRELYVHNTELVFEDHIYNDLVGDEKLNSKNFSSNLPVISLAQDDLLRMKFDILTDSILNISYRFIHCSSNWQADFMEDYNCIDGFTENPVVNYQFSHDTKVKYTHYSFSFPNANLRFKKSGNYLLVVYLSNNPNEILITRRFMVYESLFNISHQLKLPTIGKYRRTHHEIDFTLRHEDLDIVDPFANIKTALIQNGNWNTAITDLQPLLVKGNELIYDHNVSNLFEAGKEFRRFDTRSLLYNSEFVQKIVSDSASTDVLLYRIKNRSYKAYLFRRDRNGNYIIGNSYGTRPDIDADYTYVHFSLPSAQAVGSGNVYLSGAFNKWRLDEQNLMVYNDERQQYELTLFLKQGFYNYNILVTRAGQRPSQLLFEGSSTQTENEYCILVYWKDLSNNYDRLVGFKQFNSVH